MRGTVVYSVMTGTGIWYTATKAEALRAAREERAAGDEYVTVTANRVTQTLGRRALYAALLNGESWCSAHEDIWP